MLTRDPETVIESVPIIIKRRRILSPLLHFDQTRLSKFLSLVRTTTMTMNIVMRRISHVRSARKSDDSHNSLKNIQT